MLGLLLKEYYNLLRYGKTILGLAVFYLFFSIVMKNVSFITEYGDASICNYDGYLLFL